MHEGIWKGGTGGSLRTTTEMPAATKSSKIRRVPERISSAGIRAEPGRSPCTVAPFQLAIMTAAGAIAMIRSIAAARQLSARVCRGRKSVRIDIARSTAGSHHCDQPPAGRRGDLPHRIHPLHRMRVAEEHKALAHRPDRRSGTHGPRNSGHHHSTPIAQSRSRWWPRLRTGTSDSASISSTPWCAEAPGDRERDRSCTGSGRIRKGRFYERGRSYRE